MIVVYVDDLIVAGQMKVVNNFFREFKKTCSFSEPERLVKGGKQITFLGFQYSRKKDHIEIDPTEYTEKILEAFDHSDARPLSTTGTVDTFDYENAEKLPKEGKEHKRYRRMVGQFLWLQTNRRDIAYAVKDLSKYCHDPTVEDVKKANHLLRYLAGTRNEKVHLKPNKTDYFQLQAYSDADLGNCRKSKRSTSGGCILFNGSIIHTWAKQQGTVADSSTEAEFLAMTRACKEIKYITQFLDELGIVLERVPVLYVDNTSAMSMVTENVKSRVKHLDRKKYLIREMVHNLNLTVHHVETRFNIADIFTKYVPQTVLSVLKPAIMGRERPPIELDNDKNFVL